MHWQFTPYVFPVVASAVISAALALAAWHRRPAPGATSFSLLMLVVAEWALAYAVELVRSDLPTILFWDNIEWLGAAWAPTLWLAFVLQYTGRAHWLTRRTMALLVVEPLVTLLLVWTNQFHGLIESHIRLDTSGSFSALVVTYGVWYWINIVYSYLLLFVGAILICLPIQSLMRPAHLYLGQAGALLIAVVAPWLGNALTIFGLNPFPKLDLTPFAFTVTGVAMASSWLIVRPLAALKADERADLQELCQASQELETLHMLVQSFGQIVRKREGHRLEAWIKQVTNSGLADVQRFAKGLERDKAAVLAGLTLVYSNGQVEGQVNKLKLLKRTMYGRAAFPLLRQRALHAL
jgi:hypothetical protein